MFRAPLIVAAEPPICSFVRVLEILGVSGVAPTSRLPLIECLTHAHTAAGTHAGFSFVTGASLFPEAHSPTCTDRERRLLEIFPGKLLALSVVNSMNYYGYAYYEDGQKVRCMAGDDDTPVIIDWGEPLSEEQALYDELGNDLRRLPAEGLELILAVSRHVLPTPLNDWCLTEDTMLEVFTAPPTKQ